MSKILNRLNSVADLKNLSLPQLSSLAEEIREEIIRVVSKNGGHLASNLGAVELTIALHYVFTAPKDKILWDVGHQSYTHKLLTGRKEQFSTLRQYNGISGFPKRKESPFDVFDSGHSGDAVPVGLGIAQALSLLPKGDKHERPRIVVVIGDGSLSSGVALEGLNFGGSLKKDIIIILNDNEMSIAKSDSALSHYLNKIITGGIYNRLKTDVWNLLGHLPKNITQRTREMARRLEEGLKNLVVPSLIFEELGFRYLGPFDGHDLKTLINIFNRIKNLPGPILIHVVTKKGKGFSPAERNPEFFHGVNPFALEGKSLPQKPSFSQIGGETLVEIAQNDEKVVVITPGMCLGSGLSKFRENFPERFFDCGICEQLALDFASGLALSGLKPVVAIYSTFLPRAYDQLLFNICLQNLPVLLMIDRAGIVGEDGETHQGTFDLSYLRLIPNLTILAPKDGNELKSMLFWAIENLCSPLAIRYPKGTVDAWPKESTPSTAISLGKGVLEREGRDGCLVGIGYGVIIGEKVAEELDKEGISLGVVNARFLKPLDEELLLAIGKEYKVLFTIEENVLDGGFGSAVLELYERKGISVEVKRFGLPGQFLVHGDRSLLLDKFGLGVKEVAEKIRLRLQR